MAEQHPVVEPGLYPFPVLDLGRESRQLAWLRNHANYMTGNGLKDYLRAVSSIVRGLIVNLLIGLPYVLALALGVGVLSVTGWGFQVALVLVFVCLGWVMVSPVANRIWQVSQLRRTTTTGSDSSIEIRDRFESGLGLLLLLTAATALCEALSFFLDTFHLWTQERGLGFAEFASTGTLSIGIFTGLARMLPLLMGAKKAVATVVVGTIGIVAPLVAVMFVADRLVFSPPGYQAAAFVLSAGALLWLVMTVAFVIGLIARAFRRRFKLLAVAGLVVAIFVFGLGVILTDNIWYEDAKLQGRLAELDFVVDTKFAAPSLTLGRTATVRAQRTTELTLLAKNIAANPPASLDELSGFLDDNLILSQRTSDWMTYLPPEPTGNEEYGGAGEESIEAHMTFIFWVAGHLNGALSLVEEVGYEFDVYDLGNDLSPAEYEKFEDELIDLGNRLAYLAPIFDSYYSSDDATEATEELLVQVLALFDEDELIRTFPIDHTNNWLPPTLSLDSRFTNLEPKDQYSGRYLLWLNSGLELDDFDLWSRVADDVASSSPLAFQFPETAKHFPESFRLLHDDLYQLSSHVRAVRIEVARQAVFSAQYPVLRGGSAAQKLRMSAFTSSAIFAAILAVSLWIYGWLTIDPNRTSLLAMYRDRLAFAFLVRRDPDNELWVKPELDLDLDQLSRYDVDSTAPYHLINCAVNLPASKDITIRDRKSDFFIFSKLFTGSVITGYCRSEKMERVFPDMSVSTAMAISAAAASPNMGRSTSRMLAVVMVMLNLRLGYWVPNPRKLEEEVGPKDRPAADRRPFRLDEVIDFEADELEMRWQHLPNPDERDRQSGFFGIAFSGGGIRSATLNLGITQALHQNGVFDHIDYMSTVSGGGYLGSSISVSMRSKQPVSSPIEGSVSTRSGFGQYKGKRIVTITPPGQTPPPPEQADGWQQQAQGRLVNPRNEFVYRDDLALAVKDQDWVKVGEPLVRTVLTDDDPNATEDEIKAKRDEAWRGTFGDQFHWRTRPGALLFEFLGRVHERSRSVNVSDGGHVENLATIELLRRRCKFIITGDGEMDPSHRFKGLTILLRTARVELGAEIDMDLDGLRLNEQGLTETQWAIGKINYGDGDTGYLLYLKSSMTDRESEDIRGYRAMVPAFPHEPTSDQFFDEGQFESYRNLGYHIASDALRLLQQTTDGTTSFEDVGEWFEQMWRSRPKSSHDSFEF